MSEYIITIAIESDLDREATECCIDGLLDNALNGRLKYLGMPMDGDGTTRMRRQIWRLRSAYRQELEKAGAEMHEGRLSGSEFLSKVREIHERYKNGTAAAEMIPPEEQ